MPQLPWHLQIHHQDVCLGQGGHDGDQCQDHVDAGGAVGQDGLLFRVQTLAKETVEVHLPLQRTVQESYSIFLKLELFTIRIIISTFQLL